jgi:hypothetical protein
MSANTRGLAVAMVQHRARVLDHRHQGHGLSAEGLLDSVKKIRQCGNRARLARLRHQQTVRPRPASRFGIEPDAVGFRVDPHECDRAAAPHHRDRLAEPRSRRVLSGRRDRIFKIENDGVGAALMGLGEETLRAHRNIKQRPDAQWRLPRLDRIRKPR